MKITVTKLPKTQAEIVVEVSSEDMQPYVDRAKRRIAKELTLPGFRKGNAPIDLVTQHVGEAAVMEKAGNDVVNDTYTKAIEQEHLAVVGRAAINVEKIAPGNPFMYRAIVALLPSVNLGNYQKLSTVRKSVMLDEKKFTRTLNDLRRMRAKELFVTRAAQKNDKVIIDFSVMVDGVAIEGGQGTRQHVVLGESKFIPGFEENIIGMQRGEKKEFTATFPKEYGKKNLAGREAHVHATLHDVYEMQLPELNDEFAKELNFASREELEDQLRKNLLQELEDEERRRWESAVIDEIVRGSQIEELPDLLVDDEVKKMLGELQNDLQRNNVVYQDYLQHLKKTEEQVCADFREPAMRRLRAALTLRAIADAENITTNAEEIEKEVTTMQKMYDRFGDAEKNIDVTILRRHCENIIIQRKTFERIAQFTITSVSS